MWPFRKKPESEPQDHRIWNDDWKVGDIAECIVGLTREYSWSDDVAPWRRPAPKQRLIVSGFREAEGADGALYYFLAFRDWPVELPTQGFRKVRPVQKTEKRKAKKSTPIVSDPEWWLEQEPVEEDA